MFNKSTYIHTYARTLSVFNINAVSQVLTQPPCTITILILRLKLINSVQTAVNLKSISLHVQARLTTYWAYQSESISWTHYLWMQSSSIQLQLSTCQNNNNKTFSTIIDMSLETICIKYTHLIHTQIHITSVCFECPEYTVLSTGPLGLPQFNDNFFIFARCYSSHVRRHNSDL